MIKVSFFDPEKRVVRSGLYPTLGALVARLERDGLDPAVSATLEERGIAIGSMERGPEGRWSFAPLPATPSTPDPPPEPASETRLKKGDLPR